MQERNLYEYAIIRLVPRVEREEFINIGIIMFSKQAKYIKAQYNIDERKVKIFSNTQELDFDFLYLNLEVFCKIAMGAEDVGEIAQLEISERFRWLTAQRSTILQTSRPHVGLSVDLDKTFETLFSELVK